MLQLSPKKTRQEPDPDPDPDPDPGERITVNPTVDIISVRSSDSYLANGDNFFFSIFCILEEFNRLAIT